MDLILDALSRWGARLQAAGRLALAVAGLVALGGGLVVVSHLLLSIAILSNTIGGLAGGAWFAAAYLAWEYLIPANLRERTWIRRNYMLPFRRRIVLWAFLIWAGFLVFIGTAVADGPILGAMNVVVLLTLWRVFTMSAEERAEMEAAENSTEDTWTLPDGTTESELELQEMFGDDNGVIDGKETPGEPGASGR